MTSQCRANDLDTGTSAEAYTDPKGRTLPDQPQQTLRDEKREVTRRRLVRAAKTVFERVGYGQATIGNITTEAAINRATFYLHFSNKSELFNQVLHEMRAEAAQHWRSLDDALVSNSRAAIQAWLTTAFQWWDGHAAIQPAWHEAMASDPRVAASWKGDYDRLSLELVQYLDRLPADQREDARTRVQFLVLQLDQICFYWRVQHVFNFDHQSVLTLLTDMWCAALHIDRP